MKIEFSIRDTPCGCSVLMVTPKRERTKRFRNGYSSARQSAKKWIEEQIEAIRDCVNVDGLAKPEAYVDGMIVEL